MMSGLDSRLNLSHERLDMETRRRMSRLPVSFFSTFDLPPPQRFAAWRESFGVFLDVRLSPAGDHSGFEGMAESYLIDDIVLSRCAAWTQKFDRTAVRVAADSIDHYMVQLLLRGTIELDASRDARSRRCPAGHLIGFDLGDVMDTVNSDFDLLSLIIPRRRLAQLLTHPDRFDGTLIDPASGTGLLVGEYVRTLYRSAPLLSPAEASAAAVSLLDLLALAFNGVGFRSGDAPDAMAQAELLRVQNFIRASLAAPALAPDMVAAALGISRARLYRLFAPIGGIADYIREQRLRRCLADLVSTKCARRQIAEIAYSWGFSDPAHFARAFRQRFGRTPSEVRQTIPPAGRRAPPQVDPRAGDRLHEEWISALA
jgi:AraC-like DNA-binding protein